MGNFTYGQWIIFDRNRPQFYIEAFDENSPSNQLIFKLIQEQGLSIELIIEKINKHTGRKLNFGKQRPWIEIVVSSKVVSLELPPLPLEWLQPLVSSSK